jgi:hypothetical protein
MSEIYGLFLSSPYNYDMDDVLRGSDGGWTIGAYEFNSGVPDTTPDAFTFTDVTGATLSTQYISNTITLVGMNSTANVSLTGDGDCDYSKNGGVYTSNAGTAVVGDTFNVRLNSHANYSTERACTLTVDVTSDTYTVTTVAAPVEIPNPSIDLHIYRP